MELVVVSGKGGTGKTMISAALADLNDRAVKADCDVDAPNLYLYYKGKDVKRDDFSATKKASIDPDLCIRCGLCEKACQFGAITNFVVDEALCEGCGACALVCPVEAVRLQEHKDADVYLTETETGMLARAEMVVGSDGSGKLITLLRANAQEQLGESDLVIIDGSPGIGCPVISSITSADLVLLVTEPTLSGLGDLKRVITLCDQFGVERVVCVNKCDINRAITDSIRHYCDEHGVEVVGEIPFDETVPKSINCLRPITSYPDSDAGKAVLSLWDNLRRSSAWRKAWDAWGR